MTSWESPFAEMIPWSSAQWLVSHQHPFCQQVVDRTKLDELADLPRIALLFPQTLQCPSW